MSTEHPLAARIKALGQTYREIGGPAPDQWDHLLAVPPGRPVTLINLFAFRSEAGHAEFEQYAAVSAPALDAVGGRFTHFGGHHGNLVGDAEAWDLVVVGEYPDVEAVVALHEDPAYREAYRHRVAACDRQRVLIST